MKTLSPLAALAALPLGLLVTACGEPLDGSDTANLEGDATAVEGGSETTGTEYEPGEDGLLQSDVEPTTSEIAPRTEEQLDDDITEAE